MPSIAGFGIGENSWDPRIRDCKH